MLNFDQARNGGGEVEAMINSKHFALNDIENTQYRQWLVRRKGACFEQCH